ncbi:DUF3592 domain-containing protein [Lacrimispora sp. 210928-DFI.3.58]|uniref:DUF3592 domain-containing protein n=1 Tax=Lacrimispora sp. 210928-DFI.3.58 TaxID=2883214 RepID=UPI0015B586D8|nr:DUF3592 domain-containing protein [Lacrimispora sp. 210928-DFI.3.58]MCB7319102.1 DUF3592 domain-containing protein [Lacrimispora sp. 210928-DFI.3.58]
MESTSLGIGGALIFFIIALFFFVIGLIVFSNFRRLGKILNRAHEMTGVTKGTISEVVTVRRRNRSFRWKNEYPVISYQVNGKAYTTRLEFAEKRRGKYELGGSYTVRYIPSDPDCCVVDEFRKAMQRSRTSSLIGAVILFIFTFNTLISGVSFLFFG